MSLPGLIVGPLIVIEFWGEDVTLVDVSGEFCGAAVEELVGNAEEVSFEVAFTKLTPAKTSKTTTARTKSKCSAWVLVLRYFFQLTKCMHALCGDYMMQSLRMSILALYGHILTVNCLSDCLSMYYTFVL